MEQTYMKEQPILNLLLKMSLPMVVSMLVNSLYNIVDSFFVAKISENAMTALSLVFPVQNLINAVMIGFGIGINAVISFYLGAADQKKADQAASQGMLLGTFHGILLMIICLVVIHPFLSLFTNDAEIINLGLRYSKIVFLFSVFFAWELVFEKVFQAVGKMNISMICLMSGCLVNIFLDPVLIFGLGPFPSLGIEGAALATGIGQSIPAIAGLLFFTFSKGSLHFTHFRLHLRELGQACYNGSSEMISQLSNAIVTFLFNIVMMRLAGEQGVAAITILLYGQFLFNAFYLGFSIGIGPIVGFQYGAGNKKELKNIHRIAFLFVGISSVLLTIAAVTLSTPIVSVFTHDADTFRLAAPGFKIFAINFLFSGLNITSSGFFTALSNGLISAMISFCRTLVFIVLSLLILPTFLDLTGAWIAIPVAEFLTLLLSTIMHVRYFFRPGKQNYFI